jgi:hypothetical protein
MLSKAGTVAVPVAVEMPSGFFDLAHEIARSDRTSACPRAI